MFVCHLFVGNIGVLQSNLGKLQSGEKTTLTVILKGLEELTEEVPLRLINRTPEIIRMQGGRFQTHLLSAGDIKPDGTYTITRILTGKVHGRFSIRATIYTELEQPPEPGEN